MQYWHRKLQRSVTDSRRLAKGRWWTSKTGTVCDSYCESVCTPELLTVDSRLPTVSAVGLERFLQFGGDHVRRAPFDLAALHHVNELAVLHDRDRRRRWWIRREVIARRLGGFDVGAREHGRETIGPLAFREREGDTGTRLAGRASAHRIHHDHRCPRLLDRRVDGIRRLEVLESEARELGAHRRDERFRITLHNHVIKLLCADNYQLLPRRRRISASTLPNSPPSASTSVASPPRSPDL